MRLVRVPPVDPPELLEPLPEPETFEAGPEQRVHRHAEDLTPDQSPTRERRIPSHRLDEVRAGIEEQAGQGEEQQRAYEQVHGRWLSGEPGQAHDPNQAGPYEETA